MSIGGETCKIIDSFAWEGLKTPLSQGMAKLEESVTCKICHGPYKSPALVKPCQHTFCFSCLQAAFVENPKRQCPECTNPVQDVISCVALNEVVQSYLDVKNSLFELVKDGHYVVASESPPMSARSSGSSSEGSFPREQLQQQQQKHTNPATFVNSVLPPIPGSIKANEQKVKDHVKQKAGGWCPSVRNVEEMIDCYERLRGVLREEVNGRRPEDWHLINVTSDMKKTALAETKKAAETKKKALALRDGGSSSSSETDFFGRKVSTPKRGAAHDPHFSHSLQESLDEKDRGKYDAMAATLGAARQEGGEEGLKAAVKSCVLNVAFFIRLKDLAEEAGTLEYDSLREQILEAVDSTMAERLRAGIKQRLEMRREAVARATAETDSSFETNGSGSGAGGRDRASKRRDSADDSVSSDTSSGHKRRRRTPLDLTEEEPPPKMETKKASKKKATKDPRLPPTATPSPDSVIEIDVNDEEDDGTVVEVEKKKPWACKRCTLLNPNSKKRCGACYLNR